MFDGERMSSIEGCLLSCLDTLALNFIESNKEEVPKRGISLACLL